MQIYNDQHLMRPNKSMDTSKKGTNAVKSTFVPFFGGILLMHFFMYE